MTYHPISVTELNTYIKEKFNEDEYLNNVLIKGEISNFINKRRDFKFQASLHGTYVFHIKR